MAAPMAAARGFIVGLLLIRFLLQLTMVSHHNGYYDGDRELDADMTHNSLSIS